jgi:putative ABC transport system permease protein
VRFADILGLAVSALWQQKMRTLLTTLGVIFGSFVLAASLSVGQGAQDTIQRESIRHDALRRMVVRPQWRGSTASPSKEKIQVKGEMTEAKRQRIRQAIVDYKLRFSANTPGVTLTPERLRTLAAMDHVEAVVPVVQQYGYAIFGTQAQPSSMASARPGDRFCLQRLVAGRFFETPADRAVVVSEYLLYRLGLADDAGVNGVVGKKLRLEIRAEPFQPGFGLYVRGPAGGEVSREETAALDKVRQQLPAALDKLDLTTGERDLLRKAAQGGQPRPVEVCAEDFVIVGVLRLPAAEERAGPWDPLKVDADVVLPVQTALDFFFRVAAHREQGVQEAVVFVDREENLKEVFQRVTGLGLNGYAALDFIERERLTFLLIFGAMTCVAAVALLVAALGIANTMLMSVLERTREIGIMKAVGAGNGHLQVIFLIEGMLIGIVGGGLGLLLAWGTSFPADSWVRSMVARDLKIELKESLFVFPPWLALMVVFFAVLVTTLAAVYPARRAARVNPIAALRHE